MDEVFASENEVRKELEDFMNCSKASALGSYLQKRKTCAVPWQFEGDALEEQETLCHNGGEALSAACEKNSITTRPSGEFSRQGRAIENSSSNSSPHW